MEMLTGCKWKRSPRWIFFYLPIAGDCGLSCLLWSRDFKANVESYISLRDTTIAAGARPFFSLDSMKCWGKECESTLCEAFNSSFSPSENKNENALCLPGIKPDNNYPPLLLKLETHANDDNENTPTWNLSFWRQKWIRTGLQRLPVDIPTMGLKTPAYYVFSCRLPTVIFSDCLEPLTLPLHF